MPKSIAIIGAGIAGLSAGCYGQMNGYQTTIFEAHDLPGGLCTSWRRKGYTFDGCIHWLVGSAPGNSFYRVWEELGAVQGRAMVNHEEFFRIERADGGRFIMYTNADKLERHLKEISPQDEAIIAEFTKAIRLFSDLEIPIDVKGLEWFRVAFRMIPLLGLFKKFARISTKEYAQRFKDPFLKEVIGSFFNLPDFPVLGLMITLGWMHKQCAGYPVGGSLAFARTIAERYRKLGGIIHYKSRVTRILTEDNKAVGIRLADGTEHRADLIISAADGHATIFEMLEGRYLDDEIRGYYRDLPVFPPIIQVSLGVNGDFSNEPHMVQFQLAKPVKIAGEEHGAIGVRHYNYDPAMAPPGKSSLVVMFSSNYDYWKKLGADPERYRKEKEQIAQEVIAALEHRFPGIRDRVEVIDVATPLTYERYTGNWKGSMEGWLLTTKTMGKSLRKTLPGLKNFYLIGQWVEPGGGLPPAALSGRNVIKTICRRDRKKFMVTTQP